MKATDILMQEHRVIERVLGALEAAARRLDGGSPVRPGFFLDAAEFIKGFADGCHHRKEEGVLFQAMAESGIPRDRGPIAVMLAEHEEGRRNVAAMAAALRGAGKGHRKAMAAFAAGARGYGELLTQHIFKEDRILYPMADNRLSPDQQASLEECFADVEKNIVGAGKHEEFHRLLERLGAAYPS